MTLAAGILIGGASRRMGRPKALIRVNGCTLLEQTIALARSTVDDVVLLGSPCFKLPMSADAMRTLPDRRPGLGPLGGLESLLAANPNCVCLLLSCDMPNLTASVVSRMSDELGEADAAILADRQSGRLQLHPCCGIYQPRILPKVSQCIMEGRLGMVRMLDELTTNYVMLQPSEAMVVENINTPDDLARAIS